MNILKNISLKPYNTFGVDVKALEFVEVNTKDDLMKALEHAKDNNLKVFILGGGSNVLFTTDFNGLVIKMDIKGVNVTKEDDKNVYITYGAGENWHESVMNAVNKNLGGIENMALIPGTMGGAAAQNIAAYGQNISDVIDSLNAINLETLEVKHFTFEECEFKYRGSIFKNRLRNKFVITDVTLRLNKNPDKLEYSYHERKGRYGSLEEELKKIATQPYTIKDIANAVINSRNKRLPKLDEYGSCGSFFENPLVSVDKFKELSEKINELQHYPAEKLSYEKKNWDSTEGEELVKIPAARLLDELGWKGKWNGRVGVSPTHALCVVTKWEASGKEILEFTNEMKKSVKDNYGIELISEVNVV